MPKYKDYKNFKIIDMYNDYGDVTGVQTIRRFIDHCNEYFSDLNETIQEFIKVYTDLTEIKNEFDAFQDAWEIMQSKNDEFIKEVEKQLDEWIDNPEVQKWIVAKLDEVVTERFDEKLDVDAFDKFEKNYKEHIDGYNKLVLDYDKFKINITNDKKELDNNISLKVSTVDFNEYKVDVKNSLDDKASVETVSNIDKRVTTNTNAIKSNNDNIYDVKKGLKGNLTKLTLQYGWYNAEGFGDTIAREIGGLILLSGMVHGGSSDTLFTLPSHLRPKSQSRHVATIGSATALMIVRPTGVVTVAGASGSGNIAFQVVYSLD